MDEIDLAGQAERDYENAEREVRRLTADLELAEAELIIARIKLARARQAERETRGW